MVTDIYGLNEPTEVKDTILYYPSITKVMVDSNCESLWIDNSGVGLGINPTENYEEGLDDSQKLTTIAQQRLRSKILGLWTKFRMC